jgi:hypothetical protein
MPITAEAAGSSPVVPAIHSKRGPLPQTSESAKDTLLHPCCVLAGAAETSTRSRSLISRTRCCPAINELIDKMGPNNLPRGLLLSICRPHPVHRYIRARNPTPPSGQRAELVIQSRYAPPHAPIRNFQSRARQPPSLEGRGSKYARG